jgi:hypothetical protein
MARHIDPIRFSFFREAPISLRALASPFSALRLRAHCGWKAARRNVNWTG